MELPTLEVQEAQIKDAMMQYHQNTFTPNHSYLLGACKQRYTYTSLEQYYTNIQLDTIDTRLKTLEAKMGNNSILLRGLPATGFTKNNIDWNLKYFCDRADISFDQASSISNYIVITDCSILRLEFLTETLRNKFFSYAKANRGFSQKKFKVKIEADVNSSDRLARQPFYTLLEIFRKILPEEEQGTQRTTPKWFEHTADLA